ncbi:MAG: protein kinase [Chloroflexota bacterium]
MATAFVSYRRKPSAILAQLIAKDLKAQGIEVYLDIERMENAGAFPTRLFQAIDASDVFVCLLGDETLDSEWVQNEIQHAHEVGKPMIPVFQESFEPFPLDESPTPYIKTLLEYDGVYIFDIKNVYVPEAVEALARIIENTAAWAKQTPAPPDTGQVPILSVNIEALTGQQFGQYHITDLLGIGGMSAVYRAHQESLMRDVALKVLPPSFASQPASLARFLLEARTAAALEHAHIVPVYDYGNYGGLSFVVMRLLSGGSLAERLTMAEQAEQNGLQLPSLYEIAGILKSLASALDYAHSRGVIHRDIKANNVMFDDQGSPYLVDFGIAKLTHSANSLTGTGVAMGTPLYMSPEQWRGESVTPAADQYALGVTTYAMVTGHLPFDAPTPYALMHKHLTEQPPPPQNYRADVPDALKKVLEQAMAKKPNNRFPSAKAFADAFETAVQESGIENKSTEFFTSQLPDRPQRILSPLVGGTPDPQGAMPIHPPQTPSSGQKYGTPPPGLSVNNALTPLDEQFLITNPSATLPSGTPTPTAPIPVKQATPPPAPPGYMHQMTPTGQSIFVQQPGLPTPPPIFMPHPGSTPMDQAQIFITPQPRRNAIQRWLIPAVIALIALIVVALLVAQNQQAKSILQETQVAIDATNNAVQLQLTIDSATQAALVLSVTATASVTPTPTDTASPTPATPVIQALTQVAARLGPSTNYPIIATLDADGKLDVTGVSEDGGWYQVILADGTRAWIVTSSTLVNIFGNLDHIEVMPAPTDTPAPSPTASPTKKPSPTLAPTASPTITATATMTMTPVPTLHTGGTAQVSAGDFGLALRDGAGKTFNLVVNLTNQTLIDIVDGPEVVDSTNWWKVQSPEGQSGWVEAETDGKANLVPKS